MLGAHWAGRSSEAHWEGRHSAGGDAAEAAVPWEEPTGKCKQVGHNCRVAGTAAMSDDDFMCDSGEEDYDFEYESEDDNEEDANLENLYYSAKQLRQSQPDEALATFRRVVTLEPEKSEWGFRALKQTCKLLFKLERFSEMMVAYKELLTYIKSAIARNYSEKSINSILDYVSNSKQADLLLDFYQTTLAALAEASNERLWFKTNLKLGKMYLDQGECLRVARIIKELRKSCQNEDGTEDLKKGTQLLEIYALEIQMYTAQKDTKSLKTVYERSLKVKSAIPHPLVMGTIRECGGKMHLIEEQWGKAYEDFFEAFKNYDESGSPKKINCLKYLVLANMLMRSAVDPFDAQESKPYKNDPQIQAMTNLVGAYQANDIREFEKILKTNRQSIMDDPFIAGYIEDLLKNIRTEVLIKLIRPYTRVRIPFISSELSIPAAEVESLLISCILDRTVHGHIDQVEQLLILERDEGEEKYTALHRWAKQLESLSKAATARVM
eukprot:m.78007 g.78007  ORF g.78007 m.78007 type:complete len:495 (-) comp8152_c2_seq3:1481-2965(-)